MILTVVDPTRGLDGQRRWTTYTGALVDVYSLKDQSRQNTKYGIIEALRHPSQSNASSSILGY